MTNHLYCMHDDVRWLEGIDRPILVEIAAHLGWIKPASIALNLPYSEAQVTVRCHVFVTYGLVTVHDDTTAYRISRLGRRLLFEDVDVTDLIAGDESQRNRSDAATTLEFTDPALEER